VTGSESFISARSLIDLLFFAGGVGGILLAQWRSTIGVRNEIQVVRAELRTDVSALKAGIGQLTDDVKKGNLSMEQWIERQQQHLIRCAAQHGKSPIPTRGNDTR
jgi:hypothetical protein